MNNDALKEILKKAEKRFTENKYGSSYHDVMTDHVWESVESAWDFNDPQKEDSKDTLLEWSLNVAFSAEYFRELMGEIGEDISEEQYAKIYNF